MDSFKAEAWRDEIEISWETRVNERFKQKRIENSQIEIAAMK